MNSQILGLRVAGTIFGLICLAHLLRLVTQLEVSVGGHPIALWPSAVACVFTGGISLWLWKLSKPVAK